MKYLIILLVVGVCYGDELNYPITYIKFQRVTEALKKPVNKKWQKGELLIERHARSAKEISFRLKKPAWIEIPQLDIDEPMMRGRHRFKWSDSFSIYVHKLIDKVNIVIE